MTKIQTSIKPCGHHLVVKPIELPKKSPGGILLNFEGSHFEKIEKASRMIGVIAALGPQCWAAHAASLADLAEGIENADVKAGLMNKWANEQDTVLYSRHAGKYVFDPMSGDELYLIHDEDVLAVLPPQSEWTADLLDLVN